MRRRIMKPITFVLGLALAFSLVPTKSNAGRVGSDAVYCSTATVVDGQHVQGCYGTMKGFRNAADPNAFAELTYRANGQVTFQAQLNGVYFACVFETNYDTQYFASIAGNFQNS